MQFSIAIVALSALAGTTVAELCSCFRDTSLSVNCCDQIVNFETWNGYECGVTGTQIEEFETCCDVSTYAFCREE